jgi:hypothetical protein
VNIVFYDIVKSNWMRHVVEIHNRIVDRFDLIDYVVNFTCCSVVSRKYVYINVGIAAAAAAMPTSNTFVFA